MIAALSGSAAAADGLGIEARGSLGVGNMLSSAQRDRGFRTGFVPDLRPALRVTDDVAAELTLASWFFPHGDGAGRATLIGAGARFDPNLTSWLSWFVDGHGGLALTGASNRFMVDAGAGLDVWLSRNLAVGPFLRYGQVVDSGPDPRFWAAGVGATMTLESGRDEPPALGGSDRARDERQRQWEESRQRERQSPRERDRDGDGVVDARDICPDEKAGPNPDPNMLGCPMAQGHKADVAPVSGDRDGDGVPDRDDKCPGTPFGANPDPMAMGCPLADRDHDGVPDINDACPDKPGVAGDNARRNGCPISGGGSATVGGEMIQLSRPILFRNNGDEIMPASYSVLQRVADLLKSRPGIRKVSVEGHTDSSLPALKSIELSEKRAENVKQWLVNNGVEADRLIVRGHGDTRPVASNKTAKGRQANARIELVIVDGAGGTGLSP